MIYVVGELTTDSPVKIGFTADGIDGVFTRLSTLQTGNWNELSPLAILHGSGEQEAELHRRFADDRVRGEWFRRSPAIMAFVAEHSFRTPTLPTEPPTFMGTPPGVNGSLTSSRGAAYIIGTTHQVVRVLARANAIPHRRHIYRGRTAYDFPVAQGAAWHLALDETTRQNLRATAEPEEKTA